MAMLIWDAGHNSSPGLQKQLVLELKRGKGVFEFCQQLPGGIRTRIPSPFDLKFPVVVVESDSQYFSRTGNTLSFLMGGKGDTDVGGSPTNFFKKTTWNTSLMREFGGSSRRYAIVPMCSSNI